jgi:hypothetical protein
VLIKELSTPPPGSKDLYSLFPAILNSIFCLPMETTLVVLEKPTVHCSKTTIYNSHSFDIWNNLLGSWLQKVNRQIRRSRLIFEIHTPCFPYFTLRHLRQQTQDLLNAMGSMYAAVLFIGIQNATSVQPVVAIERTVFYRERAAGMYSALAYAYGQVWQKDTKTAR